MRVGNESHHRDYALSLVHSRESSSGRAEGRNKTLTLTFMFMFKLLGATGADLLSVYINISHASKKDKFSLVVRMDR